MRRALEFVRRAVLSAVILLATPGPALAISYQFTQVATRGPEDRRVFAPAINDSGGIAYGVQREFAGAVIAVQDGVATQLASPSQIGSPVTRLSINSAGSVAFTATPRSSYWQTIFVASASGLVPVVEASASGFTSLSAPVISDSGAVSFSARHSVDVSGIYQANGGTIVPLVRHGDEDLLLGNAPEFDVNAAGQVAFTASVLDGRTHGVYFYEGGIIYPVVLWEDSSADPPPPVQGPFHQPSLNEFGVVAFHGRNSGSLVTLFLAGAGIVPIVQGGLEGRESIALNDRGAIAFHQPWLERLWLVPPDAPPEIVIEKGDPLLGSLVSTLRFTREGLNNEAQLAFTALLADGREVVVRADPIPEPGSGLLVTPIVLMALFASRPRSRVSLTWRGEPSRSGRQRRGWRRDSYLPAASYWMVAR
jgi:hypothetical protein